MNYLSLVVSSLPDFLVAGPRNKQKANSATCLVKLKRFDFISVSQRTRWACRVFVYCLNNAILVCNKECEANSSLYLFKTPSRSARLKKAKRQWLREKTKQEKEEVRLQILVQN